MQIEKLIKNIDFYNKYDRQKIIFNLIKKVEEEEINPLDVHVYLKIQEDIIKKIFENQNYKDAIFSASQKNGKSFSYKNSEFSASEVGVKYDYSNCGDNCLKEYYNQQDLLKKKIKEREEFLKKLPLTGLDLIDKDNGEVITLYPPVKSSISTYKVSLK